MTAKKGPARQIGGRAFSSVRKAREALKERAFELLDGYIAVIKQAAASGDYETATKGYQYLLEHMPEEDGQRMIEISVDKPVQVEAPKGPTIQIGFQLGGVNEPKQIEAPAIEVVPIKEPSDSK